MSMFQHILNEILASIFQAKNEFLGDNLQVTGEQLEDLLVCLSQSVEYEIFISCDWNINISTGYGILYSYLKMSNNDYDFSDLMYVVN